MRVVARKCRRVCVIRFHTLTARRLDQRAVMDDWPEYDFIVPERESPRHTHGELTGWETVVFEVGDEEPPPIDQ